MPSRSLPSGCWTSRATRLPHRRRSVGPAPHLYSPGGASAAHEPCLDRPDLSGLRRGLGGRTRRPPPGRRRLHLPALCQQSADRGVHSHDPGLRDPPGVSRRVRPGRRGAGLTDGPAGHPRTARPHPGRRVATAGAPSGAGIVPVGPYQGPRVGAVRIERSSGRPDSGANRRVAVSPAAPPSVPESRDRSVPGYASQAVGGCNRRRSHALGGLPRPATRDSLVSGPGATGPATPITARDAGSRGGSGGRRPAGGRPA